jgi:hypothetical protein
LLSTIYALIVIRFALKIKKSSSLLILISFIASIVSIGFTELVNYEGNLIPIIAIFQKLIKYSVANGRLFNGMIYIPIGMLMAHKKGLKFLNWIVFIVGFIANYFIDNSIISSYLLIITAIALLGIVKDIELKNSVIYSKLRSMSITIYFVHMYVWTFYYKIVYGKKTYGIDSFIVTSIISVIIAWGYTFFFERHRIFHRCLNNRKTILHR